MVAAAGKVARQAASFARQPKPRLPQRPQATGRRRLLHCSESVKRHHPASAIVVPKIAAPGIEPPAVSAVCKSSPGFPSYDVMDFTHDVTGP